eukprot:352565-Chlamydomonas_euryale.AAC.1
MLDHTLSKIPTKAGIRVHLHEQGPEKTSAPVVSLRYATVGATLQEGGPRWCGSARVPIRA